MIFDNRRPNDDIAAIGRPSRWVRFVNHPQVLQSSLERVVLSQYNLSSVMSHLGILLVMSLQSMPSPRP